EVEQQHLLLTRRTRRLGRLAARKNLLVLRGRPAGHLAFAEAVKLRGGRKDLVKFADIAIVHQVEVELHRIGQLLRLGSWHHDLPWAFEGHQPSMTNS